MDLYGARNAFKIGWERLVYRIFFFFKESWVVFKAEQSKGSGVGGNGEGSQGKLTCNSVSRRTRLYPSWLPLQREKIQQENFNG